MPGSAAAGAPVPGPSSSASRLLCSWCDVDATYHLVADVDSRDSVHAACDEHEEQWGRLYRRSVSVVHHPVVDVRAVDIRSAAARAADSHGTVA